MKTCVRCGGTSFGEGETRGEGNIWPANKLLSFGEVNSIRARHPEKFKSK